MSGNLITCNQVIYNYKLYKLDYWLSLNSEKAMIVDHRFYGTVADYDTKKNKTTLSSLSLA